MNNDRNVEAQSGTEEVKLAWVKPEVVSFEPVLATEGSASNPGDFAGSAS
ncbi:MAG TPA: hypothetical protein VF409_05705 [Sphingomonas sp.]